MINSIPQNSTEKLYTPDLSWNPLVSTVLMKQLTFAMEVLAVQWVIVRKDPPYSEWEGY